jgi:Carboxymuconolactone decarboxylase family
MTAAMSGWGGYELSKRLSLWLRDREIIIDRTCARCRCQYEWGMHVAFFAERAGLSSAQITPSPMAARAIRAGPTSGTGCSSRRPTPCTTPLTPARACGAG